MKSAVVRLMFGMYSFMMATNCYCSEVSGHSERPVTLRDCNLVDLLAWVC